MPCSMARPGNHNALGDVDGAPFREAMRRSGNTPTEVCVRIGWLEKDGRPETSRLRRAMSGRMRHSTAVLLCEGLCLDPHEVGL